MLLAAGLSFKVVDSAARGQPRWTSALTTSRAECVHTNLYAVTVPISPLVAYSVGMTIPCSRLIGSTATAGRYPPPPNLHTAIVRPLNGTTVSGDTKILVTANDFVDVTKSEILLSGATRTHELLGVGQPTAYGYVTFWNTRNVPNGVYVLQGVAYGASGSMKRSTGVTVTVKN
jgi:hypothetical protein